MSSGLPLPSSLIPLSHLHFTVYSYYLSETGITPGITLSNSINLALNSIVASLSGNAVTFFEQMQQCFTALVMSPDPSQYVYVTGPKGPFMTLQVLVNGIVR